MLQYISKQMEKAKALQLCLICWVLFTSYENNCILVAFY